MLKSHAPICLGYDMPPAIEPPSASLAKPANTSICPYLDSPTATLCTKMENPPASLDLRRERGGFRGRRQNPLSSPQTSKKSPNQLHFNHFRFKNSWHTSFPKTRTIKPSIGNKAGPATSRAFLFVILPCGCLFSPLPLLVLFCRCLFSCLVIL